MRNYRGLTKEGKWVYGWFLKTHNPTNEDTHWIIKNGLYTTDIIIGIDNTKFPKMLQGCYQVIPETVGQQVGYKDKNDTEIYDDNICKVKLKNGHERIGVVKWEHCGYHLNVFKATDGETGSHCISYSGSAVEGVYIIGNKHQHPNLLK